MRAGSTHFTKVDIYRGVTILCFPVCRLDKAFSLNGTLREIRGQAPAVVWNKEVKDTTSLITYPEQNEFWLS